MKNNLPTLCRLRRHWRNWRSEMNKSDYGITKFKVGDDVVESTIVKFGDGLTRVSTVFWDGELSGVQLCRSDKLQKTPFKKFNPGEDRDPNTLLDDDKVYLVFDNEKSIDIVIAQLQEAKDNMRDPDYGKKI
jgi:hypothetical protein